MVDECYQNRRYLEWINPFKSYIILKKNVLIYIRLELHKEWNFFKCYNSRVQYHNIQCEVMIVTCESGIKFLILVLLQARTFRNRTTTLVCWLLRLNLSDSKFITIREHGKNIEMGTKTKYQCWKDVCQAYGAFAKNAVRKGTANHSVSNSKIEITAVVQTLLIHAWK